MAAVFAALYFVLRSLPVFPMIGISGRFTAGDILLTTIVLVAGLWSGVVSVLIGTIVAYPLSGTPFLGLDFLPGVMNILITGLVLQNRRRIAAGIYAVVLLVFIANPYSLLFAYGYVPYAWLHILGLIVLCSPLVASIPVWVKRTDGRQFAAIAALAFVGTMAQHLTGGLLFEFTLGLVQGSTTEVLRHIWQIIFWVYPTERLVIVVISSLISAGLLRSIRRLSL